ncbi:MFS transporter [Mobilicoccus massiliensis]|uniref:MFS transporter n=1 Tax=Mobilicoccus massiliensis TaxID=1522310 RepID=UPI00058BF25A|nr:MFS transporter [Mobilicoccus massiliensis]
MEPGRQITGRRASGSALWIFIAITALSLAGTRLAAIAVPWYVLTTTGSPTLTGVVAFAELAPYVVVKALCGPLIDRIGPVRVAVLGDALSMLAVAAVPLLHGAGLLSYPALIALVALIGVLRAPGDGAKTTLIPLVAKAADASLERVSGAFGAVDRLAATFGAAFGGLVIAAVGGATALWLTAATLALTVILLALALRPRLAGVSLTGAGAVPVTALASGPQAPPAGRPGGAPAKRPSYLSELREGWTFLRGDHVLVALVTVLAVTNMLEQAFGVALLPMWALVTGGGPAAIGFLLATSAAFSVIGAIVAAGLGERLPRRPIYVVAYLLVGLPRFGILALAAPMPVTLGVLAVGGFAAGFINPIIGAVIVERIPGRLMGRVNTLAMACAWALLPIGGLLGGVLVSAVGLANALWIVGGTYVLVTMAPTLMPAWRYIERNTLTRDPVVRPRPATAAALPESSRGRAARRGRRVRSRHR